MEGDHALTLRRVQPINSALAKAKRVRGGKQKTGDKHKHSARAKRFGER